MATFLKATCLSSSHGTFTTAPLRDHSIVLGRPMSTSAIPNPRIKRAFPRYSIPGETAMLAIKVILPSYRMIPGDGVVVDPKNRGRVLLEFAPRGPDGKFSFPDIIRFALDAEECGLLCSQLPHYPIQLSRKATAMEDDQTYAVTNDMPDKVLKADPGDGATISISIDYVKNGIGGQSLTTGDGKTHTGPMEVVLQAGEAHVLLALINNSIPALIGWDPLLDYSIASSIQEL